MNTLEKVSAEYTNGKLPALKVGDFVEVSTVIKEGDKERIQVFKGLIISLHGGGINKTFTVRKISSSIGVEKIFPLYAPVITKIKVVKHSKVHRSKLYYLRNRIGKAAMKTGALTSAEGENEEIIESGADTEETTEAVVPEAEIKAE